MGRHEHLDDEPLVLSAAGMIARVQEDPGYPVKERALATWAIRSACRWSGRDPEAVPFTASSVRALLLATSPGKAGVSKKTMQNARSAIEAILRFYGLGRSTMDSVPLTAELSEWFAKFSKYEKAGASRFFRFVSVLGRPINEVSDSDAGSFLAALEAEFPEKAARAKYKGALRAWNGLALTYPDWPGRQLTRRLARETWALSWEQFPPSLKLAVDALFAAREAPADLFALHRVGKRLKPSTVRNREEHLRISASILCTTCGLKPGDLTCLADLCRPDRFKAIIGSIVERYDGKVTAYVEQIAITLLQAARECGVLSDGEVGEVEALRHSVYRRGLSDRRNDVSPDQQILDELDDSDRMDALLSLPTKTVMRVHRRWEEGPRVGGTNSDGPGAGDVAGGALADHELRDAAARRACPSCHGRPQGARDHSCARDEHEKWQAIGALPARCSGRPPGGLPGRLPPAACRASVALAVSGSEQLP